LYSLQMIASVFVRQFGYFLKNTAIFLWHAAFL
jgi:hypothetical protein